MIPKGTPVPAPMAILWVLPFAVVDDVELGAEIVVVCFNDGAAIDMLVCIEDVAAVDVELVESAWDTERTEPVCVREDADSISTMGPQNWA